VKRGSLSKLSELQRTKGELKRRRAERLSGKFKLGSAPEKALPELRRGGSENCEEGEGWNGGRENWFRKKGITRTKTNALTELSESGAACFSGWLRKGVCERSSVTKR